jgi:hypothetical protein
MASSNARLNHAGHLVRHGGGYLGYVSPNAALKCFERPKVPTTTPYTCSWLVMARTIINNAVPLKAHERYKITNFNAETANPP